MEEFCVQAAQECHAGKLLQQHMVEAYANIERERLRFIGKHQGDVRTELYQGLMCGEHGSAEIVEVRVPATVTVGSSSVLHPSPAAAALCRPMFSPAFSITITCHPEWASLMQESPALLASKFRLDLIRIKDEIVEKTFWACRGSCAHGGVSAAGIAPCSYIIVRAE